MSSENRYLSDSGLWGLHSVDTIQLDVEEEAIASGCTVYEIDVLCTSLDLMYRLDLYG